MHTSKPTYPPCRSAPEWPSHAAYTPSRLSLDRLNRLDAAYHSITGMVGAGVLGLPAAVAPLGWAGGMVVLFVTFWISWYTYILLVNMHEVPDLDSKDPKVSTKRLDRYQDLTTYILGKSGTSPRS
jgi:hypothetical protein